MMSKVAIIKCESYEYSAVKAAVKRGIELIGGPLAFVNLGEKIVLKPNILTADLPERCATTHPAVFKAVAEVFKDIDVKLTYGDSPALHNPKLAAKKCGIAAAAEELGIEMAEFDSGEVIYFEQAIQNKMFTIAKGVLESDGLISISKLKAHGFSRFTGSIKNQFGCVPGHLKGEFHVRIPNVNDFSKMLIDLNMYLKPRLYVMDGIMAMEGNGPRGGDPVKMNVLLFSSDPVALDATVCRMINLNPEYVPTTKFASEAGLGTYAAEEIELLGDELESFINKNFNVKREPVKPFKAGGLIQFIRNSLVPKPKIINHKCVKCGVCVQMCPVNPKAVNWHNGIKTVPPSYVYRKCIRCYCCQELCPESAIHLKVPFIRKFFFKNKV
ncbi:MAG: DUF362 domain-containing protein [Clostridia bacterium]|nr:DUF362 domain-containing protein [Clostridia bacterium]